MTKEEWDNKFGLTEEMIQADREEQLEEMRQMLGDEDSVMSEFMRTFESGYDEQ